jgi:hypothetical protein
VTDCTLSLDRVLGAPVVSQHDHRPDGVRMPGDLFAISARSDACRAHDEVESNDFCADRPTFHYLLR